LYSQGFTPWAKDLALLRSALEFGQFFGSGGAQCLW
jgi:hypothetical protein